jgi:hypothetical protein
MRSTLKTRSVFDQKPIKSSFHMHVALANYIDLRAYSVGTVDILLQSINDRAKT